MHTLKPYVHDWYSNVRTVRVSGHLRPPTSKPRSRDKRIEIETTLCSAKQWWRFGKVTLL